MKIDFIANERLQEVRRKREAIEILENEAKMFQQLADGAVGAVNA